MLPRAVFICFYLYSCSKAAYHYSKNGYCDESIRNSIKICMTVCGLAFDSLCHRPPRSLRSALCSRGARRAASRVGGGGSRVSRVTGPVLSFASRGDRGTDAGVTARGRTSDGVGGVCGPTERWLSVCCHTPERRRVSQGHRVFLRTSVEVC